MAFNVIHPQTQDRLPFFRAVGFGIVWSAVRYRVNGHGQRHVSLPV